VADPCSSDRSSTPQGVTFCRGGCGTVLAEEILLESIVKDFFFLSTPYNYLQETFGRINCLVKWFYKTFFYLSQETSIPEISRCSHLLMQQLVRENPD
jgi:hypothetical protein